MRGGNGLAARGRDGEKGRAWRGRSEVDQGGSHPPIQSDSRLPPPTTAGMERRLVASTPATVAAFYRRDRLHHGDRVRPAPPRRPGSPSPAPQLLTDCLARPELPGTAPYRRFREGHGLFATDDFLLLPPIAALQRATGDSDNRPDVAQRANGLLLLPPVRPRAQLPTDGHKRRALLRPRRAADAGALLAGATPARDSPRPSALRRAAQGCAAGAALAAWGGPSRALRRRIAPSQSNQSLPDGSV
jgi:hypothetical protein